MTTEKKFKLEISIIKYVSNVDLAHSFLGTLPSAPGDLRSFEATFRWAWSSRSTLVIAAVVTPSETYWSIHDTTHRTSKKSGHQFT